MLCPVEDCGSKLMTTKIADHLRTHDSNSRGNNREAILGAGYSELNGNRLCPLCRVDIDTTVRTFVNKELDYSHWVGPITSHMFRCPWHKPELLHTHRREILKLWSAVTGHSFGFDPLIKDKIFKDKIFKDVLPTVLTSPDCFF